ncbi:MAG: hypothetical protein WAV11_02940 [Minisyncoccia bacterium]
MSISSLYCSLDEARKEISSRWKNQELKDKIKAELSDLFIEDFSSTPRSISFRQIITPDNGFMEFYQNSKYLGVEPLVMEYKKDIFVSFNEEKKGLGKLRINKNGSRGYLNILDFHGSEKKPLDEVTLKNGQSLIDFHHGLMDHFGYEGTYKDFSDWFKKVGRASDYYYPLLLHCVAHGVFFETLEGDEYENNFTKEVIIPTINKIKEKFGVAPIIVKLYPSDQTPSEDYYWFSYPPFANDYITNLEELNKLSTYNIINTL